MAKIMAFFKVWLLCCVVVFIKTARNDGLLKKSHKHLKFTLNFNLNLKSPKFKPKNPQILPNQGQI